MWASSSYASLLCWIFDLLPGLAIYLEWLALNFKIHQTFLSYDTVRLSKSLTYSWKGRSSTFDVAARRMLAFWWSAVQAGVTWPFRLRQCCFCPGSSLLRLACSFRSDWLLASSTSSFASAVAAVLQPQHRGPSSSSPQFGWVSAPLLHVLSSGHQAVNLLHDFTLFRFWFNEIV